MIIYLQRQNCCLSFNFIMSPWIQGPLKISIKNNLQKKRLISKLSNPLKWKMTWKCIILDTENVLQLSIIQREGRQNCLKNLQLLLRSSRVTADINSSVIYISLLHCSRKEYVKIPCCFVCFSPLHWRFFIYHI